jgi:hypothetical protein
MAAYLTKQFNKHQTERAIYGINDQVNEYASD